MDNNIEQNKPKQRVIPISIDRSFNHILDDLHINDKNLLINNNSDKPYIDNKIVSTKYSITTFVPKQVLFQFRKFANSYFLIISILQMIPGWSTTGSYTTIIPLLIFISISVLREGYDDFRRYQLDCIENKKLTNVMFIKGQNKSYSNVMKVKKLKFWQDSKLYQSLKLKIFTKHTHNEDSAIDKINDFKNVHKDEDVFFQNENTSNNNIFFMANQIKDSDLQIKKTEWHNLRVGDFVIISNNENIPADILILSSTSIDNNQIFVETKDLDGETNLKVKNGHSELYKNLYASSSLQSFQAKIEIDLPNSDLYNFQGNLKTLDNNTGEFKTHSLNMDNICLRGSVLRNTDKVLGMVLYSGEETKIRMNAIKSPKNKAPKLQRGINMIVIFMALLVLSMSLFSFLGFKINENKYVFNNKAWYFMDHGVSTAASIMGFIIMYNTLIPLSLYVTMELIKLMQSKLMEWDIDMYYKPANISMESRTATILEELGQVSYIFSDKTGTLTDNIMIFKKFSILGTNWKHCISPDKVDQVNADYSFVERLLPNDPSLSSTSNDSKKINSEGRTSIDFKNTGATTYSGRPSIASFIENRYSGMHRINEEDENNDSKSQLELNESIIDTSVVRFSNISDSPNLNKKGSNDSNIVKQPEIKSTSALIKYIQEYPDTIFAKKVNFFLLCLSLCHTCLPKKFGQKSDNNDTIEYQAASPDELALIIAARDMGYVMIDKTTDDILIKTYPNGFDRPSMISKFKVLEVIDFNSDRKRMSVIVKKENDLEDEFLLICKGADNVILERLENQQLTSSKISESKTHTEDRKQLQNETLLEQRKSLSANAKDSVSLFTSGKLSGIPRKSLALANIDSSNGRSSNLNVHQPPDVASRASLSLKQMRNSISRVSMDGRKSGVILEQATGDIPNNIDTLVEEIEKNSQAVKNIGLESKIEHHRNQMAKYNNRMLSDVLEEERKSKRNSLLNPKDNEFKREMDAYIGDNSLTMNDEYVLERVLESIEDFSTEGLRTLLYAYKILDKEAYYEWYEKYQRAKTSVENRKENIDAVGGEIETDLKLLAATAIEDKLQEGVPEAIEKFKRAGIKMWMLTGDKRETAINIGYSCNLIYEYSSVIVLDKDDVDITAKMLTAYNEIFNETIAHCVVVVDGQTLKYLQSLERCIFFDLCMKCDSVIVCRASPSQKADMVKTVKQKDTNAVTLAIGDGANDIAMIQSADIGVGIAGKEGLQASRASDYSIGQFRFLLKLLLVHGRYNYSRTCLFILATFYKEAMFYLGQMIYQRWTMFSGTSLYEPWSLSMFNTLFTSLPVLCIGMFHKDLKASTLLAIPELYTFGRLSQGFNFKIFLYWIISAAANACFITFTSVFVWGSRALKDNGIYAIGFINFTVVIFFINIKLQFIEMRNRSPIEFASTILSCGGWLLWSCVLPAIYSDNVMIYDVKGGLYEHFGTDVTLWATMFVAITILILFDMLTKVWTNILSPSDASLFAQLEKNDEVRKKLEFDSYMELQQGWTWEKDISTVKKYQNKLKNTLHYNLESKSYKDTDTTKDSNESNHEIEDFTKTQADLIELDVSPHKDTDNKARKRSRRNTLLSSLNPLVDYNKEQFKTDPSSFEVLPSGKIIRKKTITKTSTTSEGVGSKLNKKLKFITKKDEELNDEDIQRIIEQRMKDLDGDNEA
ncbi:related to Probable phospholipid-transporting ATPase DNF3 [Hanseniaspora guilliermondii]|uniref:Phospholipid-transporting ATPase n=1 Tax=Hanseniaspora guilliermondii TaxID=56406 RepID=A0A1L0B5B9_9ASCO|nr:related to Probable phospholipid-transporting ATPase DNF3 [Hanseniaspora guilliermondii]